MCFGLVSGGCVPLLSVFQVANVILHHLLFIPSDTSD